MEEPTNIFRCMNCGAPLTESGPRTLCAACASRTRFDEFGPNYQTTPGRPAGYGPGRLPLVAQGGEDPDRPRWSVASAIAVWVFSIAVLLSVQFVAIFAWGFVEEASGRPVPLSNQEALQRWLQAPSVVLVSVVSSLVGHLLTLAVCWAIVTGLGRTSLLRGLGWPWTGPSALLKFLFVIVTTLLMLGIFYALDRTLPSEETPFDRLLKTSQQVRVAVALLAVFSAPIVEEVVYRGILYSALRNRIGLVGAVVIVTVLFGSVHFAQYWGAWSSIIGVTLLSFVLTVIRAVTKSIKPCVAIHLLNNVVGALGILWGS